MAKKSKPVSYTVINGFDIDEIEMRKEIGDTLDASEVTPEHLKALLEMNCIEDGIS